MSDVLWAPAFPGGVADASAQHALWRNSRGQMVALRLADGQPMWCSAEPLLPLLLGHGLAIGLALSPPSVVALGHTGDTAAQERWRSAALPWPGWAAAGAGPASTPAAQLQAGWAGGDVLLHWHLQPLYRGGAAPGPSRGRVAAVTGNSLLDARDGSLRDASALADAAALRLPEPAPLEASDDPGLVAQQQLHGVRYRLHLQPVPGAGMRTVLSAHTLADGRERWQCTLEQLPRPAPRALRS